MYTELMHKRFNKERKLEKVKDEQGWAVLIPIIIAVVSVIALVGYLVTNAHHKKNSSSSVTPVSPSSTNPQAAQNALPQNEVAAWPVYTDQFDGYSIKYPQGWYVQPAVREGSTFAMANFDRTKVSGSGDGALTDSQYIIEVYATNNSQHLDLAAVVAQEDSTANAGYKLTITNQQTVTSAAGITLLKREVNNESTHTGAYEAYAVTNNKYFVITGNNNSAFKATFDAVADSLKVSL
jgi:hypothetical protein